MRFYFVLLAVIVAVSSASSLGRADEIYTFVIKKQEDKAKTRWSLSDWLETRDKMRLMDLWLAIHSPSPYEFFFSGAYIVPSSAPSGAPSSGSDFGAAAFATIFGLEGRRESFPNTRYLAMFDLRIFGYHDQSTNITGQFGLASQDLGGGLNVRNPITGVRMDIYLARYFGVGGLYRHYFDSTPNQYGTFGGDRYEGQAFIDFQFLRINANYFSDSNVAPGFAERKGVGLGAKVYF